MQDFCVVLLSAHPQFSATVVCLNWERAHMELEAIGRQLCEMKAQGDIVFDLLAPNGSAKRRFFVLPFDGTRFTSFEFRHIEGDAALRGACAEFYVANLGRMDLSLLPAGLRDSVEQGVPV